MRTGKLDGSITARHAHVAEAAAPGAAQGRVKVVVELSDKLPGLAPGNLHGKSGDFGALHIETSEQRMGIAQLCPRPTFSKMLVHTWCMASPAPSRKTSRTA